MYKVGLLGISHLQMSVKGIEEKDACSRMKPTKEYFRWEVAGMRMDNVFDKFSFGLMCFGLVIGHFGMAKNTHT